MPLTQHCHVCHTTHDIFGTCPTQSFPSWRQDLSVKTMDQRLRSFLDSLWMNRNQITSSNDIYARYNAVTQPNRLNNANSQRYFAFLDSLHKIYLESESFVSVQDYSKFKFTRLLDEAKKVGTPKYRFPTDLKEHIRVLFRDPTLSRSDAADAFRDDLCATFFHYFAIGRQPKKIIQRVYLNVKAEHAVKVMKFIVTSIVVGLPGVGEAKIAGPSAIADRNDVIVIYSTGEITTDAVLERLAEYQRLSGEHFGSFIPDVPQMTLEDTLLSGVGVGSEPNKALIGDEAVRTILQGQQSFGGMRSKLIWRALSAAKSQQEFLKYTTIIFKRAGLSVSQAYL